MSKNNFMALKTFVFISVTYLLFIINFWVEYIDLSVQEMKPLRRGQKTAKLLFNFRLEKI